MTTAKKAPAPAAGAATQSTADVAAVAADTAALPITTRPLAGWSRTTPIAGHVLAPRDVETIATALAQVADAAADKPTYLSRGVIARDWVARTTSQRKTSVA